jgi:hypothetical protein
LKELLPLAAHYATSATNSKFALSLGQGRGAKGRTRALAFEGLVGAAFRKGAGAVRTTNTITE